MSGSDPRRGAPATKRLWEVKHPYYCNEGNYLGHGETIHRYDTWKDFFAEWGDADFDMNLVFRWDWEEEKGEDGAVLKVFWMGQRKGYYQCSLTRVSRADEPDIRKWLEKRFRHMLKLWSPFA